MLVREFVPHVHRSLSANTGTRDLVAADTARTGSLLLSTSRFEG